MAEKKYYVLRTANKDTEHVFSGSAPRQAALKAATRNFTDIKLRERGRRNQDGTYSVHNFKGSRKKVSAPANAPSWLPKNVWKPTVRKVGVDRIKKL
ncbi:MAG: non-histone chromosomal MC1 family protein [archaeon]